MPFPIYESMVDKEQTPVSDVQCQWTLRIASGHTNFCFKKHQEPSDLILRNTSTVNALLDMATG